MSIQKIFTKKLTILSNFEDNDDVLLVLLNNFFINFEKVHVFAYNEKLVANPCDTRAS